MKVLIDACVLYPTLLREIVIRLAKADMFQPLWSDRILEEWRRAAGRNSAPDAVIARAEADALTIAFPGASVDVPEDLIETVYLPDKDDRHVLAAAIAGQADEILTLNTKDFPTNVLASHGIMRRHPDEFLLEAYHSDQNAVREIVEDALDNAASHGISVSNRRGALKRSKLPRLGKALAQS